jgi:hypothetical protein
LTTTHVKEEVMDFTEGVRRAVSAVSTLEESGREWDEPRTVQAVLEEASCTLAQLAGLERVSTTAGLASWNAASTALVKLEEVLRYENTGPDHYDTLVEKSRYVLAGTGLHSPSASLPLLAQAIWGRLGDTDPKRSEHDRSLSVLPRHLGQADLEAAEESARAVFRGPRALAWRTHPGQLGLRDSLGNSFRIAEGSSVACFPVGALGFIAGRIEELVLLDQDALGGGPDLERRLEALEVLTRTGGTTPLADLFEATSEL